MGVARRIAGNLFSLSFAEFAGKGFGFVVVAYLARVLGAASFGKFSFAQSISTYFQLLVNLGLDIFGTREVARSPQKARGHIDHILTIRLLVAVLSFGLLALLARLIPKDAETKLLLLIMGFSVLLFAFTTEWLFQAIESMRIIAVARILQQASYATLVLALVAAPQHVLRVPVVRVVSTGLGSVLLLAVMVRKFGWPRLAFDLREWTRILRQSLPIGVSFILITVYYNADTIILGFLKSDEIVGWYNAAYKNILLLVLPADTMRAVFLPALSRVDDRRHVEAVANGFLKIMFILGIPVGFAGTILAPHLIDLVYGPEYASAIVPLRILMWNVVLVFVNQGYGAPLLAWGKQGQYIRIITVSAATNLVFNFLLIPPFGMVGAAVATILAEVAAFAGGYAAFQRELRVPFARHASHPVLAAVGMTGVLLVSTFVFSNFFVLVAIGLAAYFAVLFASGGIGREDLRAVFARE